MSSAGDSDLAAAWLRAVEEDAALVRGLEAVYEAAGAEIAQRGPACWASGRCCNFDRAGHRLYVTGLEAAYCVSRLRGSMWAEGPGGEGVTLTIGGAAAPMPSGRGLSEDLEGALRRGGCPFQVRNLCGVHGIKPLGCRVYFCDKSAEAWQQELTERLLGELRALHDRHGVEYRYGEWRGMLGMFGGKA
jgi:Fe-S-cluster containining protein